MQRHEPWHGGSPSSKQSDLMRTHDRRVVEEQIHHLLPRGDRQALQLGIVHYSREIAFAAAAIYARAAEARGAWDSRIEATIVDAVVRAETDESMLSRASTLGWNTGQGGRCHRRAPRPGFSRDCVGPRQSCRWRSSRHPRVTVWSASSAATAWATPSRPASASRACTSSSRPARSWSAPPPTAWVAPLALHAPLRPGYRAAKAWPEGPQTMLSADLLPERALAGDGHARRSLASEIYPALASHKELLDTCVGFLDAGSSMEATARACSSTPTPCATGSSGFRK